MLHLITQCSIKSQYQIQISSMKLILSDFMKIFHNFVFKNTDETKWRGCPACLLLAAKIKWPYNRHLWKGIDEMFSHLGPKASARISRGSPNLAHKEKPKKTWLQYVSFSLTFYHLKDVIKILIGCVGSWGKLYFTFEGTKSYTRIFDCARSQCPTPELFNILSQKHCK